ncbi:MAG: HIRAN domain-containing protein [Bacilli bacterium]|nr:HIRAN domain-containing protein [Bacilli bacterium]
MKTVIGKIKGITFHINKSEIFDYKEGDYLKLVHEPTNEYDKNAIGIYDVNNKKLGFVEKERNSEILKLINNKYYCLITKVYYDSKTPSIEYKIIYGDKSEAFESEYKIYQKIIGKLKSKNPEDNIDDTIFKNIDVPSNPSKKPRIFDLDFLNLVCGSIIPFCHQKHVTFSSDDPNPEDVPVGEGQYLNAKQVCDLAEIYIERQQYNVALQIICVLLMKDYDQHKYMHSWMLKILYKVLLCMNEFYLAFILCLTILENRNNGIYIDENGRFKDMDYKIFVNYGLEMKLLAISNSDSINLQDIQTYISNFTFNGPLVKDKASLSKDIKDICSLYKY